MTRLSLYRTYRPRTFAEVMGQEPIVSALTAQIEAGSVAHAYLFAGSRGLGKTSVARIFARELGVTEKDLYEIDAASHTGVDHIRTLTENVYTLPFESPYKCYILDEAHMLSKGAWNAFLKTLEEPPAHALFILATTELSKVPETVQSRCQVFEFRKPSRAGLTKLIAHIAKKEGYTLGGGVAELVALLADGSYRDALSVLERVFAVSKDKKIERVEAEQATGAPRAALVLALIEACHAGDTEKALVAIRRAAEGGADMALYLTLVLEAMRSVLLIRHAKELRGALETELGEEYAPLYAVAESTDSKLTHATLAAFIEAASRMRYASVPALPLELAVLSCYS
ncbi:MAG: DNA polymerase III subunit gamma/tau [Minisyncoccia bacterium]